MLHWELVEARGEFKEIREMTFDERLLGVALVAAPISSVILGLPAEVAGLIVLAVLTFYVIEQYTREKVMLRRQVVQVDRATESRRRTEGR
jgi:hypothetical protein